MNNYKEIREHMLDHDDGYISGIRMMAEAMNEDSNITKINKAFAELDKRAKGGDPLELLNSDDTQVMIAGAYFAALGIAVFKSTRDYIDESVIGETKEIDRDTFEEMQGDRMENSGSALMKMGYLMSKDVSAISNEELSNTITGLHMGEPA